MPNKTQFTEEQLIIAIKQSDSINQVCRFLGLKRASNIISTLIKQKLQELNIDYATWHSKNVGLGVKKYNQRWTLEQLIEAVKMSDSLQDVKKILNLSASGGNTQTIKKSIEKYNIDTSHWTRRKNFKNRKHGPAIPLNNVLIKNSNYSRGNLKKRLINENILANECNICHLINWLDSPIILHLDHINGINNDNRLENLRLLCPNCHSQTDTYSGKNIKINRKIKQTCPTCNQIFYPANKKQTYCSIKCFYKLNPAKTKIQWPTPKELEKIVWELPTTKLAQKLGVSDKAIDKKCKKFNIKKPPRGYWQKLQTQNGANSETLTHLKSDSRSDDSKTSSLSAIKVGVERIELSSGSYQKPALPLGDTPIKLVEKSGF